ncbi:MAG TPA: hypothetical protein VGJ59_17145 [Jatrophihabitantaceae bacterium]
MSLLQFGSNRAAEQQPITSIDQPGVGSCGAAVADAVPSQYADQA